MAGTKGASGELRNHATQQAAATFGEGSRCARPKPAPDAYATAHAARRRAITERASARLERAVAQLTEDYDSYVGPRATLVVELVLTVNIHGDTGGGQLEHLKATAERAAVVVEVGEAVPW